MLQCPFSSVNYLHGLSNIGKVDKHPENQIAVLRRSIPNTDYFDGVGPWPYRWINSDNDIELFHESFKHLVTLSIVTHPGWIPSTSISSKADIRLLKQHYVYDPERPPPALSRRAHKRLLSAEKRGFFESLNSLSEQLKFIEFYQQLKLRRGLLGGFFDMPPQHFETITQLPNSVFFQVRDKDGIGAMACGLIINDFLQILHLVITDYGLTWNASYLMMHSLQKFSRHHSLRLLTGGMPNSGAEGLATFKARWANAFLPVHLLCVVNDLVISDKLASNLPNNNYFPRYRNFG